MTAPTTVTEVMAAVLTAASLAALAPVRDEGGERSLAAMPYSVTREGISTVRSPSSGRGAGRRTELVQLDLFQNRTSTPDDPTLMVSIWQAFEAAGPAALQAHKVLRLEPQSSRRVYDRKTQVVTESLIVRVTHSA